MPASTRLSLDGWVGAGIAAAASLGLLLTPRWDLSAEALLLPRLSVAVIAIGGAVIVWRDLRGLGQTAELSREPTLFAMAAATLISMFVYGWFMEFLGIATATFLFLAAWWAYLRPWAIKPFTEFGQPIPKWATGATFAALAVLSTAAIYLMAIHLLNITQRTQLLI